MSDRHEPLGESVTYEEAVGLRAILAALGTEERGIINGTVLARDIGLHRTTLHLALRLAQAAGYVETRSLGTKGTHVRVLDRPRLEAALAAVLDEATHANWR